MNACHMEGICAVLDHARHVAYLFDELNEYNLIIRLLTGLQQYSEMIYIFDILFQANQCDLLLSKISEQNDESLSNALFDYIKRHQPNEEQTFTSIAMELKMHQELAVMHRDAAEKLLKTFHINQSPSTLSEMSVTLQSLLHYYSAAADTFYLAGCCRQSEQCLRQARLISLQLEFLPEQPLPIILNLNTKQVHELLPRFNRCWHTFIIADAYNEHAVWPACLIEQFICNTSPEATKYWEEFRQIMPIDDQLISNIGVNLLKKNAPTINQKHFQEVLSQVTDISILIRLQQSFLTNDSSLSNVFAVFDSPYLLDTMRVS